MSGSGRHLHSSLMTDSAVLPGNTGSSPGSSNLKNDIPGSRNLGPTRSVTLHNVSSAGSGAISASQDGERCVVVGRDSIRILRITLTDEQPALEAKHAVGQGGYRIDASKNMFVSSSSKVDGALTDVVWCQGTFDNKIVTSARNGEFALWDLQKSGSSKLERRSKGHTRAVNKLSYNGLIPYCCTTSSSDGYLRLWDLRDPQRTAVYIHHSAPVRSSVFAPSRNDPFRAITGLDNGNINRWDLRAGPKGLLDWIPLGHSGPVLSLDWCNTEESGWLASAGFDRTVKVWEYPMIGEAPQASAANQSHGSKQPSYTLHASFPVRRVAWRPGHETELAIASSNETSFSNFSSSSITASSHGKEGSEGTSTSSSSPLNSGFLDNTRSNASASGSDVLPASNSGFRSQDMIEVWDVRRSWLAKWTIHNNNQEGGVTDMLFADSNTLWVHHPSGSFSQMDMRFCDKPIAVMPRNAVTWSPTGSLSFAAEQTSATEVPYDDVDVDDELEGSNLNKRLGSEPYTPSSQTVGTLFSISQTEDWETFARLAQGYRLDRDRRAEVCGVNAEVAFAAGDENIGRIWLVLQDLLTNVVTSKSVSHKPPGLPHSVSAPAGVPSIRKSPPQKAPPRSSSSEPQRRPVASQKKGTPSPSPRPPSSPLATTLTLNDMNTDANPTTSPSRTKVRNQSVSGPYPPTRPRRNSLRRISLSAIPFQDDRIEQSNISLAKPRRTAIGEGALEDSSSSEESAKDTRFVSSTPHIIKERRSSSMSSYQGQRGTVSSPLARDDNWPEDEQEDSASPRSSSDAESDISNASTKPMRATVSKQARSRSSTLASLAPSLRNKKVNGTSAVYEIPESQKTHSSSREPKTPNSKNANRSLSTHKNKRRSKSHFSAGFDLPDDASESADELDTNIKEMQFLEQNHGGIKSFESGYRELAWEGIREGFQSMLEEGNNQMCAMLVMIASRELGISDFDAMRITDAYIDLLSRLRLHSAAAYIRKHSEDHASKRDTQIETTIYNSCIKCGKAIMKSTATFSRINCGPRVGHNYCSHCKQSTTKCSICRLPVKAALFVCSVCLHGGHQDCYRKYYLDRPPSRYISNTAVNGSQGANDIQPGSVVRESWGHACAVGCGHICWLLENFSKKIDDPAVSSSSHGSVPFRLFDTF